MEHQEFRSTQPSPGTAPEGDVHTSPIQLLFEVLKLEGWNPEFDSEGDVAFRYKGLYCYVIHSKQDAEFVRILIPQIHTVADEAERVYALQAVNYVNSTAKAAKLYVHKDKAHAAMEFLIADPAALVPSVVRCVDALEYAVRGFRIALDIFRSR